MMNRRRVLKLITSLPVALWLTTQHAAVAMPDDRYDDEWSVPTEIGATPAAYRVYLPEVKQ